MKRDRTFLLVIFLTVAALAYGQPSATSTADVPSTGEKRKLETSVNFGAKGGVNHRNGDFGENDAAFTGEVLVGANADSDVEVAFLAAFGSGATCCYNYVDLMIRNGTEHPYRLALQVGKRELEGAWYSDAPQPYTYQVYQSEHRMQGEYWGGYTRHNVIRRRVLDSSGKLVGDEFVTENHAIMMYHPLLEKGESLEPEAK